jgi:hypothetical protein
VAVKVRPLLCRLAAVLAAFTLFAVAPVRAGDGDDIPIIESVPQPILGDEYAGSTSATVLAYNERLFERQMAVIDGQLANKNRLQQYGIYFAIALGVGGFILIFMDQGNNERVARALQAAIAAKQTPGYLPPMMALEVSRDGLKLSNATAGVLALLLAAAMAHQTVTEDLIIGGYPGQDQHSDKEQTP